MEIKHSRSPCQSACHLQNCQALSFLYFISDCPLCEPWGGRTSQAPPLHLHGEPFASPLCLSAVAQIPAVHDTVLNRSHSISTFLLTCFGEPVRSRLSQGRGNSGKQMSRMIELSALLPSSVPFRSHSGMLPRAEPCICRHCQCVQWAPTSPTTTYTHTTQWLLSMFRMKSELFTLTSVAPCTLALAYFSSHISGLLFLLCHYAPTLMAVFCPCPFRCRPQPGMLCSPHS